MEIGSAKLTPMVKQYLEIKKKYPDAILFFRLGDFYEMFFEDAYKASKILGIALTARNRYDDGSEVPMCGVPHHSASQYIKKLVEHGFKVAICEQLEDPSKAKGIVKRDVVKVVTPGTIDDEDKVCNFIASIFKKGKRFGVIFFDPSISKGRGTVVSSERALMVELIKANPSEFLVEEGFDSSMIKRSFYKPFITSRTIKENLSHPILQGLPEELKGAGRLLVSYLEETGSSSDIEIEIYSPSSFLMIDDITERNLELFKPLYGDDERGTLYFLLNRTQTHMGNRMLIESIKYPFTDISKIEERLDTVEELVDRREDRERIKKILSYIKDLDRLSSRLSSGRISPRDLALLRDSIFYSLELEDICRGFKSNLIKRIKASDLKELLSLLSRALTERPPLSVKEGGVIKKGYDEELDELRNFKSKADEILKELEEKEKNRTKIPSLKIGYNKVFGYYIEITKTHLSKVPKDYIRKQTLTSAERFINAELKDLEAKILSCEERIIEREEKLFEEIKEKAKTFVPKIKELSKSIGLLDLVVSFAEVSDEKKYTRPDVDEEDRILIKDGRHPTVESLLPPGDFIPNDTLLDKNAHQILLLTGPNMSGKSTYVRQVALIVLLAQMGCFVPASSAKIGIVDRIFTRIGATDNISLGRSTFMVEMSETANILKNITPRSLIVLDEIGRGTSTYDGISIAWSVCEFLHDLPERPLTLFATHYHELADIASSKKRVKNLTVAVSERDGEIVFLRKIKPGRASRSYGITVAKLAGIPDDVIKRAEEILRYLEERSSGKTIKRVSFVKEENIDLIEILNSIDLINMTPLEALNKLAELKNLIRKEVKSV